jgi:hypothetical protein
MIIKHSKYKNTGILFELLVRQITADTLSGAESQAINILKKYFTKTELGKEYKLYESFFKHTNTTEAKADMVISTLIESSKQLNRSVLKRQKYNLIKEIKNHYDLEEFFKTKLSNYKAQAALFTLLEVYNSENLSNPNQIIENKTVLLEYLVKSPINKKEVKENILEEFRNQDKDIRVLAYRVLLEKFNDKYADLNSHQKSILKEFINSVDNTPKLREFYNTKINEIKNTLLFLKTIDLPTFEQLSIEIIEDKLNFNRFKISSYLNKELHIYSKWYSITEKNEEKNLQFFTPTKIWMMHVLFYATLF